MEQQKRHIALSTGLSPISTGSVDLWREGAEEAGGEHEPETPPASSRGPNPRMASGISSDQDGKRGSSPAPPKLIKFRQKMPARHGKSPLAVEHERHGDYHAPRPLLANPGLSPWQPLRGRRHARAPKTKHGCPLPKTGVYQGNGGTKVSNSSFRRLSPLSSPSTGR